MIGIIGAMEDELLFLREIMGKFITQKVGEFEFHTGKIEGRDVTLLRCGIGKVNAAVGCAVLIQRFKCTTIINTGSAGGINIQGAVGDAIKVGDAVISSGLIYHDVDVTAFNYAPGQLPGKPQIFPADEELAKLAETAVDELKKEAALPSDFNYRRGIIGSGDIFMHNPESIKRVSGLFPDMVAVEMEGAAIAHCCYLFSIPVVVTRALSDIAGVESPLSFKEFLPIASKHSAHIVTRIVKLLNK
ncbi:MAG: 5'-methylthioadenosine/adenosylhomocysteine nucleosidase [Treponema sp.]|nr:5'-methylthioadenosine/adenosylhomocysteine nucleosidase [Treponema sp.]